MYKIIFNALLTLFVSAGLVVGVNDDARGKAKQIIQETKETIRQTVELAVDSINDIASQADTDVTVEAGAEADAESGTDVYMGETSDDLQAGAELDSQTEFSGEFDNDDELNFGGEAGAGLNFGLYFGK